MLLQNLLHALRSSEFWMLIAQGYVEFAHAPVPDEFRGAAWLYIAARIGGKVVKFIFPHPDGGAWFSSNK